MKILVPVDGSRKSEEALDYIIRLRHYFDLGKNTEVNNNESNSNLTEQKDEIIILHVIPNFHVPLGFDYAMRSLKTGQVITLTDYIHEMTEVLQSEWENKLCGLKKKYESKDILIRTKIFSEKDGSIAEMLIRFAEKEKINLIVVGAIGLGGNPKFNTFGSVSRRVSEMAKCPVLIVH